MAICISARFILANMVSSFWKSLNLYRLQEKDSHFKAISSFRVSNHFSLGISCFLVLHLMHSLYSFRLILSFSLSFRHSKNLLFCYLKHLKKSIKSILMNYLIVRALYGHTFLCTQRHVILESYFLQLATVWLHFDHEFESIAPSPNFHELLQPLVPPI